MRGAVFALTPLQPPAFMPREAAALGGHGGSAWLCLPAPRHLPRREDGGRLRPCWAPGYFPRSFTTSKKEPGREGHISRRAQAVSVGAAPRAARGTASELRPHGSAASHAGHGLCAPAAPPRRLTLRGRRRRHPPLSRPHPGPSASRAGRASPRCPGPAAAPTPPPAAPAKVGPGAARPLLGVPGCERTGEGPSPPPPPAPGSHSAGRRGLLPAGSAPPLPLLPPPPSPRAGLAGERPLRLLPLPGREPSEAEAPPPAAPPLARPPQQHGQLQTQRGVAAAAGPSARPAAPPPPGPAPQRGGGSRWAERGRPGGAPRGAGTARAAPLREGRWEPRAAPGAG
ncbi:proline-rich protein HaeIII subfamily 1-like [Pithys albifrons albifrons]|uniref:proline-rich protein HaeIII subfamily 1-like n=1 Tax=Pithys albifrons albifrons TaxID=3385563 RepID=UPI003A5D0B5F